MSATLLRSSVQQPCSHGCVYESDISLLKAAVLDIKDSVHDMKDLLTAKAVLEEQVVATRYSLQTLETRIHDLELNNAMHKGRGLVNERLIWALFSSAMAGLALYRG